MSTPKAVSDYMRDMQARSAKSRWAGMTAAEKSAAMKALRAKGKRKTKARALRQNNRITDAGPVTQNETEARNRRSRVWSAARFSVPAPRIATEVANPALQAKPRRIVLPYAPRQ